MNTQNKKENSANAAALEILTPTAAMISTTHYLEYIITSFHFPPFHMAVFIWYVV